MDVKKCSADRSDSNKDASSKLMREGIIITLKLSPTTGTKRTADWSVERNKLRTDKTGLTVGL